MAEIVSGKRVTNETGEKLAEYKNTTITNFQFNLVNNQVYIGFFDGRVVVWNVATNTAEMEFRVNPTKLKPNCLAVSNSHFTAYVACEKPVDGKYYVQKWKGFEDRKPYGSHDKYSGHYSEITCVKLTNAGEDLISFSHLDGTMIVWSLYTHAPQREFNIREPGPPKRLTMLDFIPDYTGDNVLCQMFGSDDDNKYNVKLISLGRNYGEHFTVGGIVWDSFSCNEYIRAFNFLGTYGVSDDGVSPANSGTFIVAVVGSGSTKKLVRWKCRGRGADGSFSDSSHHYVEFNGSLYDSVGCHTQIYTAHGLNASKFTNRIFKHLIVLWIGESVSVWDNRTLKQIANFIVSRPPTAPITNNTVFIRGIAVNWKTGIVTCAFHCFEDEHGWEGVDGIPNYYTQWDLNKLKL